MEQTERAQVVEYVTGSVVPADMTIALGYSRVFRDRIARTFSRLDEQKLVDIGMRKALAQQLVKEKEKVIAMMRRGELRDLQGFSGMGEKTFRKLVGNLVKLNSALTDGKVTIDTKRILRLPSSLHSGVSMKCVLVKDIENFSIESAIPKFMREGK
jgi:DNA primase small subunit